MPSALACDELARPGGARGRARRRQLRDLRGRAGGRMRRASSPSTRTSTCATASRTARRCGGSSRTGSIRAGSCRSGSPTSPTPSPTPGARPTRHHRDHPRRRAPPRGRRGHGARRSRSPGRAAAASTSTSTSTSATARWRRAARRRCRAASRRGSCARSCGPRHPMPGCAAPISSKSTRPRTRRTDAPCASPRCACWNSSPEGRCCHDRLVLVRHAKSDWGDPALDDHDRPLERSRAARCAAHGPAPAETRASASM